MRSSTRVLLRRFRRKADFILWDVGLRYVILIGSVIVLFKCWLWSWLSGDLFFKVENYYSFRWLTHIYIRYICVYSASFPTFRLLEMFFKYCMTCNGRHLNFRIFKTYGTQVLCFASVIFVAPYLLSLASRFAFFLFNVAILYAIYLFIAFVNIMKVYFTCEELLTQNMAYCGWFCIGMLTYATFAFLSIYYSLISFNFHTIMFLIIPFSVTYFIILLQNTTYYNRGVNYVSSFLALVSLDSSVHVFMFLAMTEIFPTSIIATIYGCLCCATPIVVFVVLMRMDQIGRGDEDFAFYVTGYIFSLLVYFFTATYPSIPFLVRTFFLHFMVTISLHYVHFINEFDRWWYDLIEGLNRLDVIRTKQFSRGERRNVWFVFDMIPNDFACWKLLSASMIIQDVVTVEAEYIRQTELLQEQEQEQPEPAIGSQEQPRLEESTLPSLRDGQKFESALTHAMMFCDLEIILKKQKIRTFKSWFCTSEKFEKMVEELGDNDDGITQLDLRKKGHPLLDALETKLDARVLVTLMCGESCNIPIWSLLDYYLFFLFFEMKDMMFVVCNEAVMKCRDVKCLLHLYFKSYLLFEKKNARTTETLIENLEDEHDPYSIIREYDSSISLAVCRQLKLVNAETRPGVPIILEKLGILRTLQSDLDSMRPVEDHHEYKYRKSQLLVVDEKKVQLGTRSLFAKIFMKTKGTVTIFTADDSSMDVHIEVLILKSNFFFSMMEFKGDEYNQLVERRSLQMQKSDKDYIYSTNEKILSSILSKKFKKIPFGDDITFEVLSCLKCYFYLGNFNPDKLMLSMECLLALLVHCHRFQETGLEEQVKRTLVRQSIHDYRLNPDNFLNNLVCGMKSRILECNFDVYWLVVEELWIGECKIPEEEIKKVMEKRKKMLRVDDGLEEEEEEGEEGEEEER